MRGGSWNNPADNARAAYRNNRHPTNRNNNVGFRVVLPVPGPWHRSRATPAPSGSVPGGGLWVAPTSPARSAGWSRPRRPPAVRVGSR
jgi:hypothetical protein